MKAVVNWLKNDDINFEAVTENGNQVVMDSTEKLGAKPMEMILMGLGGCASYDVVSILQKGRQAISAVSSLPRVPIPFLRYLPRFIYILWLQAVMSKKSKSKKPLSCLPKNTAQQAKCLALAVLRLPTIMKLLPNNQGSD